VYLGYELIGIDAGLGKPAPTLDAQGEAIVALMKKVMERRMKHDPAIQAGIDAVIAAIDGQAIGPTHASKPAGGAGWVIDEADMLSASTEYTLNEQLAAHEQRTSNQVVVVTTTTLQGQPIASAALQKASTLKIGQKGKDNGVLLFVVRDEHQVRIEVGYGLEASLPDARCARIIREEIVPAFKEGSYDRGVSAGVSAILRSIDGTYAPNTQERLGLGFLPGPIEISSSAQFVAGIFFWIVGPLLCMLPFQAWSGYKPYVGAGVLFALPALYVCTLYPTVLLSLAALLVLGVLLWLEPRARRQGWGRSSARSTSAWSGGSSYSRSSSGSSSSSSSGPSFSGGGGRFGGGGASGSW
jgi:uncharacterized protein